MRLAGEGGLGASWVFLLMLPGAVIHCGASHGRSFAVGLRAAVKRSRPADLDRGQHR